MDVLGNVNDNPVVWGILPKIEQSGIHTGHQILCFYAFIVQEFISHRLLHISNLQTIFETYLFLIVTHLNCKRILSKPFIISFRISDPFSFE